VKVAPHSTEELVGSSAGFDVALGEDLIERPDGDGSAFLLSILGIPVKVTSPVLVTGPGVGLTPTL